MKKLFTILLILCFHSCFSQVAITQHRNSFSCSGAGLVGATIVDITLTAGNLYVLVVMSDSSNNYGARSGTIETWEPVSETGNFTRKIGIYRCMPTTTTTDGDLTVSWTFGNSPNMLSFTIFQVTGAALGANGANAIDQIVTGSGTASANPTITMATIRNNGAVLAAFSNSTNTFSGTPEGGWTESIDNGCTTYPGSAYINGVYVMYRTPTSDNTPTVTASASDWIGVALAIRGGRRVSIIN